MGKASSLSIRDDRQSRVPRGTVPPAISALAMSRGTRDFAALAMTVFSRGQLRAYDHDHILITCRWIGDSLSRPRYRLVRPLHRGLIEQLQKFPECNCVSWAVFEPGQGVQRVAHFG